MAGKTTQTTAAASVAPLAPASPPATDRSTEGQTLVKNEAPTSKKRQAPVEVPTQGATNPDVDFDAEMRKLDFDLQDKEPKTEPKGGKTETPKSQAEKQESTPEDPLDQELDEAEAAIAKANLKVAEPEDKTEPESDETEESNTPENEDESVDVGDPKYAEWLKSLSPKAAKKIERQQKQIATLKAAAANAIQIAPTADSPLAHVSNQEQLEAETQHWTHVQNEVKKLQRAYRDDPSTELEITLPNGTKHAFADIGNVDYSEDVASSKLAAVPDARQRLADRANAKPWETATKLTSDLFVKDSPSNKTVLEILKKVPQFATAFPDWEVKLAHMLRSMQMDTDTTAKKAKWVRLELDEQGNVKMPKKSVAAAKPPAPRVPSTPNATRPALSGNGKEDSAKAAIKKLELSGSDDDLREALRTMMVA